MTVKESSSDDLLSNGLDFRRLKPDQLNLGKQVMRTIDPQRITLLNE